MNKMSIFKDYGKKSIVYFSDNFLALWVFAIFIAICVNGCQERKMLVKQAESLDCISFYVEKWEDCGMPK